MLAVIFDPQAVAQCAKMLDGEGQHHHGRDGQQVVDRAGHHLCGGSNGL